MRLLPWFWHVTSFLSYSLCRLRLKIRVRLHADVPDGAVLLCAKHGTGFDIPLLARWCRELRRDRPYFQMGSFVGYRVLRPLVPLMRRLGGFSVMRPKEVLRLRRRRAWTRERITRFMKEVNDGAEETREAVLRAHGTLVVFPEGTRDEASVRPLVSDLEVRTSTALASQGLKVSVWPAVLSYGTPRFFRRPLIIDFLPPFTVGDEEPASVLRMVAKHFESHWLPPAAADELASRTRGPSGLSRVS